MTLLNWSRRLDETGHTLNRISITLQMLKSLQRSMPVILVRLSHYRKRPRSVLRHVAIKRDANQCNLSSRGHRLRQSKPLSQRKRNPWRNHNNRRSLPCCPHQVQIRLFAQTGTRKKRISTLSPTRPRHQHPSSCRKPSIIQRRSSPRRPAIPIPTATIALLVSLRLQEHQELASLEAPNDASVHVLFPLYPQVARVHEQHRT